MCNDLKSNYDIMYFVKLICTNICEISIQFNWKQDIFHREAVFFFHYIKRSIIFTSYMQIQVGSVVMNRTHECIVIIELRLSVLFPNFVRWMAGLNLVDQGYEVND